MANSKGWKPGRWKAVCDRCGFRFHSDALKLEWDGLRVCNGCYETRNPQEFLRVTPEKIVPPWVRPEGPDNLQYICWIWARSPYADLGEADCAIVGGDPLPYVFLEELKGNTVTVSDPDDFFFGQLYLDDLAILFNEFNMGYQ